RRRHRRARQPEGRRQGRGQVDLERQDARSRNGDREELIARHCAWAEMKRAGGNSRPSSVCWLLCVGAWLPEQERRQSAAAFLGDLGFGTGGFEDLEQLVLRRAFLPALVLLEDGEEVVGGLLMLALAGENAGEIEAGVKVVWGIPHAGCEL